MPRLAALALLAALSALAPRAGAAAPPSIVVFLADDLGYSDVAPYGGEIPTPHLAALAAGGVRFRDFTVTPRCSPTRAALLTGLAPHLAGMGHLPELAAPHAPAYRGEIPAAVETLPEALARAGYRSYLAGKWHLTRALSGTEVRPGWPLARGFDRFYGVLAGASSYYWPEAVEGEGARARPAEPPGYLTDAIGERAARFVEEHAAAHPGEPFFLLVAFTAPHWPLQAPETAVARHEVRYAAGWDALRRERFERMRAIGLLAPDATLPPRDPEVPAWEDAPHPAWQARRMAVYAAMVERMDAAIGHVLASLRRTGAFDDALVVFLSDNGASAEAIGTADRWLRRLFGLTLPKPTPDGRRIRYGNDPTVAPGPDDTWQSVGRAWAHVSNTPFAGYKMDTREGGIASPLIVHWPAGLDRAPDTLVAGPAHVTDLTATFREVAGLPPAPDRERTPGAGESLLGVLRGGTRERAPVLIEHEGHRSVRRGRDKAVSLRGEPWRLHDVRADPGEQRDLAARHPGTLRELAALHAVWAEAVGVEPWPWVLPVARHAAWAAGTLALVFVLLGLGVGIGRWQLRLRERGGPSRRDRDGGPSPRD